MTITLTDFECDDIIHRVVEIDHLLVMLGKIEGENNGRCPITDKVTKALYGIATSIDYAKYRERHVRKMREEEE
tara:strand:+ start:103 stop:324 length:222 start_codon:yes stop_codon:yes gene_type:complete